MSEVTSQSKKKKKLWVKIGVPVVALLIGINVLGGNSQDTAAPASTPTPAVSSTTTEPAKPAARDAATIAADVDAQVKEVFMATSYGEMCVNASWACGITEIGPGNVAGNVNVMVQEKLTKDEAERIAMIVLNNTVTAVPDVDWVIVYDLNGVVKGQKKRSDSPFAQR